MKVSRPHEHAEELIAADALGGLDRSDREALAREMAEHGVDCAECHRLIAQYGEVAGWLALSSEPAPLAAGAEDRLLRAARRASAPPSEGPKIQLVSDPTATEPPEVRVARPRRSLPARWLAAAVAAAVVGVLAGYSIAPRPEGVRVVALDGVPGQQVAVAYEPRADRGWVIASNLPDPGARKVYELWFRRAGATTMEPAGTFRPSGGSTVAPATVAGDTDFLAVTIEREPGTSAPTSDPIFSSAVPPS